MRLRSISACSWRPTLLCYGLCYKVDHFREPVTRTETLHFFESFDFFVDFFATFDTFETFIGWYFTNRGTSTL